MPTEPDANLPLSEQTFFILLSLIRAPRHGYAILKEVKQLSGGRLSISVSTLYTSLKRLLDQGWIERVALDDQDSSNHLRKAYQLTNTGQNILYAETRRLQTLVQAAHQHLPDEAL